MRRVPLAVYAHITKAANDEACRRLGTALPLTTRTAQIVERHVGPEALARHRVYRLVVGVVHSVDCAAEPLEAATLSRA